MGSSAFRRRLRRYRLWWPVGLAVAGALILVLVGAIRSSGDDRGVAGPLLTVCVIAGLAGLATGLAEGLVQPSAPVQLRIRMILVVITLITAAILGACAVVAGLVALIGSGVALGSAWCGQGVMSALLPHGDNDDNGSE